MEEGSENFVSLQDMRELRVAHFTDAIGRQTAQNSVTARAVLHICEEENSYTSSTVVSEPELSAQETATPSSVLHEEDNSCSGRSGEQEDLGVMSLTVHRSVICSDMIEQFKDTRVMNSSLLFTIINERGKKEEGVGVGEEREVYSLFWKEFANSMTIGERERVPFVRRDHFIKEWEAVGRILVKGYQSVSYFPLFLSKAFICYCLFDAEVPESILLESFMKYLSAVEEDLLKEYLEKACLPDDNDELLEFLERFNCRSAVSSENLRKLLIEIANQELIQKPHVMISTWKPSVQELKQYPVLEHLWYSRPLRHIQTNNQKSSSINRSTAKHRGRGRCLQVSAALHKRLRQYQTNPVLEIHNCIRYLDHQQVRSGLHQTRGCGL